MSTVNCQLYNKKDKRRSKEKIIVNCQLSIVNYQLDKSFTLLIMIRNILLLAFLSVLPLDMSAQIWVGYKSDSVKTAEYREKIALDYSMPDYSVTSIDEKKIGSRLANLKQVDIQYHFKDGVSESYTVNDMFSHMSHYAQVREQLNK